MKQGEAVLMTDQKGKDSYLFCIGSGASKVDGLGVLDFEKLKRKEYGELYELGSRRFLLTKPTVLQVLEHLKRKAQVIIAKDIAQILLVADVANARLIIEGGAGSGFLTCAMASAIRPGGRIVTYELRQEFADVAGANLGMAGLRERVEFVISDITKGIRERDADAVIVDIPDPALCAGHAYEALRAGGVFVSYVPNVEQFASCVKAMRIAGFSNTTTLETLQRRMVAGEQGTRPDFEMLGHTGYITFGYKLPLK